MSRTTSRGRAAGIGLGALAAVALVASPVAAAPAEDLPTLELGAEPEDVQVVVYGGPADEDQGRVLDSIPVPETGNVSFSLPSPVSSGEPVVTLVDPAIYEDPDFEWPEDGELPTLPVDVTVETVADADGAETLLMTIPMDDPALEDVDEVELNVLGLEVEGLPGALVVASTTVDLQPGRLGQLLLLDPAPVEGYSEVFLDLDEVAFQAGGQVRLDIPQDSALDVLGFGRIDYADAMAIPGEDGFGWVASVGATSGAVAAEPESLAAAVATGRTEEGLADVAEEYELLDEEGATREQYDVESEDELEEDPYYLEAEIDDDGRGAVLQSSAALPGGDYLLYLNVGSFDSDLTVGGISFAEVEAAPVEPAPEPEPEPSTPAPAPQPTPTVTVTAPAPVPTATATRVPTRQNPGLRSNTGVETAAAPGLSDGQLVGLGAGLLVLGSAAGAVALRSQRRARA